MKFELLDAPHVDLSKTVNVFPETVEFSKMFFRKLFERQVGSYDKSFQCNILFLEDIL